MSKKNVWHAIGLMSGSSLDGLDIAYCKFQEINNNWSYEVLYTETASIRSWYSKLKKAKDLSESSLEKLTIEFAEFLAEKTQKFISKNAIQNIDVVVSHGHTIYHFPHKKITYQLGDGYTIAKKIGIPVVSNLRQADIDIGGQGAPIVPIGDLYLYKKYRFCFNIGGIANVSIKQNADNIIAFDICAANQLLNYYANKAGLPYDKDGDLASKGQVSEDALFVLNNYPYFNKLPPKSLDNSFSAHQINRLNSFGLSLENNLATCVEHIAVQLTKYSPIDISPDEVLLSGGGVLNSYLIKRWASISNLSIKIPNLTTIHYKEAIVIAFFGVRKLKNEINILSSVTGALKDSVGGVLHFP